MLSSRWLDKMNSGDFAAEGHVTSWSPHIISCPIRRRAAALELLIELSIQI